MMIKFLDMTMRMLSAGLPNIIKSMKRDSSVITITCRGKLPQNLPQKSFNMAIVYTYTNGIPDAVPDDFKELINAITGIFYLMFIDMDRKFQARKDKSCSDYKSRDVCDSVNAVLDSRKLCYMTLSDGDEPDTFNIDIKYGAFASSLTRQPNSMWNDLYDTVILEEHDGRK